MPLILSDVRLEILDWGKLKLIMFVISSFLKVLWFIIILMQVSLT